MADADILIACAPLDETNLLACKIAHDLFGVQTTIARIRSPEFENGEPVLGAAGFAVDQVICCKQSVTAHLRRLSQYPEAFTAVIACVNNIGPGLGKSDPPSIMLA